ncbi:hypothetical protein [Deinococcus sp.]|uniref:hypothetical protein n=1 Tax=Deinococcus sp. TaxID=47478 RepID=UPI003CC58293
MAPKPAPSRRAPEQRAVQAGLLALCLGLASCAQNVAGPSALPQAGQQSPTLTPPSQVPAPVSTAAQGSVLGGVVGAAALSSGSTLDVLDTSLGLTLQGDELRIRPGAGGRDLWVRLRLPGGKISPFTLSPDCACLRLGRQGAAQVSVQAVAGLSVETALAQDGPWTVAALIR